MQQPSISQTSIGLSVKLYREKDAVSFIEDVANLRIKIFREYPYLYEGDFNYEKKYLNKFLNTKESIICIAFDGENVIGAFTGLPLQYEELNIQKPWLENGYNVADIYYFSEILILPEYRGKRLGAELFSLAENWVASLNKYNIFSLATVVRPENHPEKPVNYKPLDNFWIKRNYFPVDNLLCYIPWKEINQETESDKPLLFWRRDI